MAIKEGVKSSDRFVDSKLFRVLAVLLSALLLFVGPTYIPYAMIEVLKLNATISSVTGLVLFLAGIALMVYFARKKLIT